MISLDPALAQAIRERPADDELRLRAAGQMPAPRGDLVRVQCALARATGEEREPLERREREILRDHEEAWTGAWRHAAASWRWSRGFVEEIRTRPSLMLAEALVAVGVSEPGLRTLDLVLDEQSSGWDDIERALAAGGLRSVRVLRVHHPYYRRPGLGGSHVYENERVLRALAAPVDWPLEELEMHGGSLGMGNRSLGAFTRSPMAAAVTRLALVGCGVNVNGVLSIAPWSPSLTELDLSHNAMNQAALRELARAGGLLGLTKLVLNRCSIGEPASREIAKSRRLPALVELHLSGNTLTGESLAGSSRLSRLSRLDLSNCNVGEEGAVALARSPHLAGLSELDLSGNVIPELAQKRLRDRFGDRVRLECQGRRV